MSSIHRLTQVSSSLDVLHEYAARGAPSGTVVVATEQLEGRGTRGRTWHSPPGGFWYSILYRDVNEAGLEFLSLRVGLAVAAAMESVVPRLRLALKWPNDLMLLDRKLGGVLCEARWQGALGWVAVGIGVNVANAIPEGLAGIAVSLDSIVRDVTPGPAARRAGAGHRARNSARWFPHDRTAGWDDGSGQNRTDSSRLD
jgi:BirA family transcriptional regulator, biotin operon repressor / biotin---[acetyl-CoA-carboxylase] ligase